MSAAKERLSGRTAVPPARSKGRRSVWRVLWYSIILAVLVAAIFGVIAYALKWPGIIRFYHWTASRSAETIPLFA